MKRLAILLATLLCVNFVTAGTISVPYTFTPNTTIKSAEVNANFATIYNDYNGNISDANVAAITETKITFTGTGHDHSGGTRGMLVAYPVVQGRLTFGSATQIKVCPYNGNRYYMKVSGVLTSQVISSSCIAANNTSIFIDGTGGSNLAANTTYYVYLFDNAGTPAIDYSTTGHATDTTTGLEIKSAVDTRVLVGMVRTNGSSQFSAFLVLSYWNRQDRTQTTGFTADRSTASGSYVELNSEIQNTFLTWADEAVFTSVVGSTVNSGANNNSTAIFIDGNNVAQTLSSANVEAGIALSSYVPGLSEGFHTATVEGGTNGGTGTWRAADRLNVKVRG